MVLRDPHPAVVAILLENPHVTEPDVVRIAAARPAVPEALAKLAVHPRWSVRRDPIASTLRRRATAARLLTHPERGGHARRR